jgi:diguanylate cyclase (GGDEF)-like protein
LLSDKIRLFNKARRLSITDALTGLYNTRHFYDELNREIERSHRYEEKFSIILCDIDNFKSVNDELGHQAGDEVLCSVADILTSTARMTDTVARYGGEEFILILPETTKDKAEALAERIRISIDSRTFLENEGNIRVSISCGVASYPVDSQTSKGILYCSDMAMYRAKELGKNRVVCYGDEGR